MIVDASAVAWQLNEVKQKHLVRLSVKYLITFCVPWMFGKWKNLFLTCSLTFASLSLSQIKWLDALTDGSAGLKTITSCMSVCDLKNDSYYKLIAAEIPFSFENKPKLRVYKGTQVVHEQGLPGIPSSVQSLYIEELQPKMPSK